MGIGQAGPELAQSTALKKLFSPILIFLLFGSQVAIAESMKIEIIPMQKLVTVFTHDTMGLTKLLPDYVVESDISKTADNATKIEMSHFYSSSKLKVWFLNFFIKRKIARETQEMLNAMKERIEFEMKH